MKIACLLAAVLLSLSLSSVTEAQGRVNVEVDAGFDGFYSGEYPTPVRVRLSNPGASFRARLELEAASTPGRILYYTEIDLPQNSSKQVTLYPHFAAFAANTTVRVLDGNTTVADGKDELRRLSTNDTVYVVMARDTSPYAALATRSDEAESVVAQLAPEAFPERADALLPLTTIIVDGVDTRTFSEEQKTALRSWVELGGVLTIAGGANAEANIGGLGNLAPVSSGAQQNASDLTELAKLSDAAAPTSGVITQATAVAGAEVAASSPQGPLVVNRAVGRGRVTWLAYSPSESPFREWAGSLDVIRSIARDSQPRATSNLIAAWSVDSFLRNIAGTQLPPTLLVAAFLLLYTLVLGPLLYLVLKRQDRRELAWVMVPAITVLFSGLAYGANFLIRGTGTTVRTVEIVDAFPGTNVQYVTTYAGLFSPGRRSYDLALTPELTFRPHNPEGMEMMAAPGGSPIANSARLSVEVGEQSVLRDVQLDVYSMRTFAAQQVRTGGPPALEAQISGDGSTFEGQVRNVSAMPLENVYFIDQSGMHVLGAISPGESKAISSKTSAMDQGWGESLPPEDWDRRQLAQSIYDQKMHGGPEGPGTGLGANEVLILAWQKAETQAFSVLDARAQRVHDRLTVLHSSYELTPGAVELELRPQRIPAEDAQNRMTLTFQLPAGVVADSLRLVGRAPDGFSMPPMMGGDEVEVEEGVPMPAPGKAGGTMPDDFLSAVSKVEIKEAGADRWSDITGQIASQGESVQIREPGPYVGQRGIVQARITGEIMGDPNWVRLIVSGRKQ